MYRINSYVVYKKNICIIKDIKTINNQEYYVLESVNDIGLKITLPTSTNLQKIMTKKEANDLLKKIKDIPLIDLPSDKYIENTYKELILSGNKEDLIKIIKTTYKRNNKRVKDKKKKSDRDEKYFNQAEKYLYTELSVVLNKSYKEIKDYITELINE